MHAKEHHPQQLSVLYDSECGVCSRFRLWVEAQPALVPLVMVPLQARDLEQRFPGVSALHPEQEILVIDERGAVYRGPNGWLMCLWALREYRPLSHRLATPELKPLVKKVCGMVSQNRMGLSKLLGLRSDALAERARRHVDDCATGSCEVP